MKNCRLDPHLPARSRRHRRMGLFNVALISIIACTPWPMGRRISSDTIGLVGEWRDTQPKDAPQHAVLRFRANGRSELVRQRRDSSRVYEDTVWTSRWELHQGHGPDSSTTVVCFNVRRSRNWPLCKSVHMGVVSDSLDRPHQRLTLEGWIGYAHLTTEVWIR